MNINFDFLKLAYFALGKISPSIRCINSRINHIIGAYLMQQKSLSIRRNGGLLELPDSWNWAQETDAANKVFATNNWQLPKDENGSMPSRLSF